MNNDSQISSQWGISSINNESQVADDADGSQPDIQIDNNRPPSQYQNVSWDKVSDFSSMLEKNYMKGVRQRLEEAEKAMRDGIVINQSKLAELQKNKESLGLVEAVELAALEFLQKKQSEEIKKQAAAAEAVQAP